MIARALPPSTRPPLTPRQEDARALALALAELAINEPDGTRRRELEMAALRAWHEARRAES
jgi:hypothetical protein